MMYTKTTLYSLIATLVYTSTCNQVMYDELYKAIIVRALNKGYTQDVMDERNNDIRYLRALCNGQLSTYERGKYVR